MQYVKIDRSKRLAEDPSTGHNRWHPDVEPIVEADEGEEVVLETRDASDGRVPIGSDTGGGGGGKGVHPLTGPVYVKGAEPGDLLEAQLVEIEADPWEQWGYTVEVPGFGFLREEFPDPFIVHWRLRGNEYAESDQLPGVRIRCNPHLAASIADSFCGYTLRGPGTGKGSPPNASTPTALGASIGVRCSFARFDSSFRLMVDSWTPRILPISARRRPSRK